MSPQFQKYLSPTAIIDSDHNMVIDYAMAAVKNASGTTRQKTIMLDRMMVFFRDLITVFEK